MELALLRNLGVVAHIDAGKTTLSEHLLGVSGVERRVGAVDEGTTVMDWMLEERERGITITAAATCLPWGGHTLNLIDTPGHVDFTVEVERCMRVLDGAVLVVDAVAGVQAQSETVWLQMRRHGVPAIAFVNKCDRAGADVLAATASLRERLGAPAIPIQYPLFEDGVLRGSVDLISRELRGASGTAPEPTPDGIRDEVEVLRSELVDALLEDDDALIQVVLDEREPEPEELRAALRRRVIEGTLVPVLCGVALRGTGVEALLDVIVSYLPSPLDLPRAKGVDPRSGEPVACAPDPTEPLAALAFKLHADAHGDLTFVRIYSGRIDGKSVLWNPRTGAHERVARILRMHAHSRVQIESAEAGDIVALVGLKATSTGDTLCAQERPVVLEPPSFPDSVISMMVEPASSEDRDKLRVALERMVHEDPSLQALEDEGTGQWLVSGMGELHLEVTLHRLKSEQNLQVHVGKPRVAYRETVVAPGESQHTIERTLAGRDVHGCVALRVEPLEGQEAGLEVVVEGASGIPPAYHAAVRSALEDAASSGPLFGFPLVGARVRVHGGASKPELDAEMAFTQAAVVALRKALEGARVALFEPRMHFEIQTPAEFSSGIIADLNARRAEVAGVVTEGGGCRMQGRVALAQMFGYSTAVRSLSQGRAAFSMRPEGFSEVPAGELAERGLTWSGGPA